MCVVFRVARDAGATFINRNWIAKQLHRSVRWVTDSWNKTPDECFTDFGSGRPLMLSQESRAIVASGSHKQRKSDRKVAEEILWQHDKKPSHQTVG